MKYLTDGQDYFILLKIANHWPLKKMSPNLNNFKNNSYFKVNFLKIETILNPFSKLMSFGSAKE